MCDSLRPLGVPSRYVRKMIKTDSIAHQRATNIVVYVSQGKLNGTSN